MASFAYDNRERWYLAGYGGQVPEKKAFESAWAILILGHHQKWTLWLILVMIRLTPGQQY